jgi:cytoskeleton protein RodZ
VTRRSHNQFRNKRKQVADNGQAGNVVPVAGEGGHAENDHVTIDSNAFDINTHASGNVDNVALADVHHADDDTVEHMADNQAAKSGHAPEDIERAASVVSPALPASRRTSRSVYNDHNSQPKERGPTATSSLFARLTSVPATAEEFTLTPSRAFTKSAAEPADVKATSLTGPSIKEPDMTLRESVPPLHVVPPVKASSTNQPASSAISQSASSAGDMRDKPFSFSGVSEPPSPAMSSAPSGSYGALPPGALLKAARERVGMSVGDIATRLRMSVRQVEAIDTDHYEALPKGPFLRGFMRNYAKVVGVDVNEILALLDRTELGASTAQKPAMIDLPNQNIRLTAGNPTKPGSKLRIAVTVAVLLALAAAVGYWWTFVKPNLATGGRPVPVAVQLSDASTSTNNATQTMGAVPLAASAQGASSSAQSGSVATPPAGAGPPNVGELPDSTAAAAAAATTAAATAAATTPVATIEPAPLQTSSVTPAGLRASTEVTPAAMTSTAAQTTPAVAVTDVEKAAAVPKGSSRLSFAFTGRSWVEVVDGRGKTVLSKRFEAGESDEAIGRPPFSIVVGNAEVTRMTYNGKDFDLAPHTRVSVARVTIK